MDLVSLATLRTRAQAASDLVNDGMVSDTEWKAWINYGAKRMYDTLTSVFGDNYFLKIAPLTVTSGSNLVTLPTDFFRELAIDLSLGKQAVSLQRFQMRDRNKYNYAQVNWGAFGAPPLYNIVGNQLMLMPVPTIGGQALTLYYYPTLQVSTDNGVTFASSNLVNDSDVIDGVNGYEELVVLEAAIRAKIRDDSDPSALMAQRAEVKQWIEESARNRNAGDPMFVGDVRSNNANLFIGG